MFTDTIKDTNSTFTLPEQTCQRFTLADIHSATNNFDETLVIGHGGFGKVYKCHSKRLSLNEVAIKRLHSMSNQGASEFEAEVEVLSRLRHANLVTLIGYCNEGNEIVLVYEFMPNGTLEDHLHNGDTNLSWLQRLKICIGVARGLDYLHEGTSTEHGIIHRDVKTSNILLDKTFAAKISDFGLAKVSPTNQIITFVKTRVKGTFGYMDPSYFYSGKLTRKSDVYAFGVVLFEVLSGKQAVDPIIDEEQWSLAAWAQDRVKEGKVNQIIDIRLIGQIPKSCLKEFARIASRCLANKPKQRPSMAEVVVKLEFILSRERESTQAGVDEGKFINKVRYFFKGKTELIPARAVSETSANPDMKSDNQIMKSDNQIMKSKNQSIREHYTYGLVIVSPTYIFKYEKSSKILLEDVSKDVANEKRYALAESGAGLETYIRKRQIGTSELHLKPKEFDHPNLVKFLGYSLNKQELSCTYELIGDASLDKLLYRDPSRTSLSWGIRLKIAVDAARGLTYLHQRKHPAYSQFKTECILVGTDFTARLWDYEVENSFVSIGSYSFQLDAYYAAPEWFRYQADAKFDGRGITPIYNDGFGLKSEVYSFGVVLLEILTGLKVFDEYRPAGKQNLVKWATPFLADEIKLETIMDPQLQQNNSPPKGAFKLALLVSHCLQPKEEERPSMENILRALQEYYEEESNKAEIKDLEI